MELSSRSAAAQDPAADLLSEGQQKMRDPQQAQFSRISLVRSRKRKQGNQRGAGGGAAGGGSCDGGATSFTMNTFSPGRISPRSRRAISSIAAGSSRSRRAS